MRFFRRNDAGAEQANSVFCLTIAPGPIIQAPDYISLQCQNAQTGTIQTVQVPISPVAVDGDPLKEAQRVLDALDEIEYENCKHRAASH